MRQVIYTVFITSNYALWHFWQKEKGKILKSLKLFWPHLYFCRNILHSAATWIFSSLLLPNLQWDEGLCLLTLFVVLSFIQSLIFAQFPSSIFLLLARFNFPGSSLYMFPSRTLNVVVFPWSSSLSPLRLLSSFQLLECLVHPQRLVVFHFCFLHSSSCNLLPLLHNLEH